MTCFECSCLCTKSLEHLVAPCLHLWLRSGTYLLLHISPPPVPPPLNSTRSAQNLQAGHTWTLVDRYLRYGSRYDTNTLSHTLLNETRPITLLSHTVRPPLGECTIFNAVWNAQSGRLIYLLESIWRCRSGFRADMTQARHYHSHPSILPPRASEVALKIGYRKHRTCA